MTHKDILRQIPEYVLGLLPDNQSHVVERHVVHCPACQQAVASERIVGQLVQSTLDAATTPNTARLRTLMPAVPQRRKLDLSLLGWQKQLAPALLVLILLFGGLAVNSMLPENSVPGFVATAHAATATQTNTPTATLVQVSHEKTTAKEHVLLADGPVIKASVPKPPAGSGDLLTTPDPYPTPVAAIQRTVQ